MRITALSGVLSGVLSTLLVLGACQRTKEKPNANQTGSAGSVVTVNVGSNAGSGSAAGSAGAAPGTHSVVDLDSKEILARTETVPEAYIKHIMIAWKDLAPVYRGGMDPRAQARSNGEAATLANQVVTQLQARPDKVDDLVKMHSEDPNAKSGEPYIVTAESSPVPMPEFTNLALRLKENEAGIVKTAYGYHVLMRIPKPKPDPLESADILAREKAETGTVHVQHVLVGWKDLQAARDPRAQKRTKEEADKLATEILAKVKKGAKMPDLMKEHSEDPGSKDTGRIYDLNPRSGMVAPFKNLSLRLAIGEAGMVRSPFGWHVIKRIPPPPPDPLQSEDILKREPVTQKAKVKHILLAWNEMPTADERAKKRDRKQLEKLVKDTVAKLKKGDAIEPLMKELSEDPGSAATGESYEATPDANLVPPFKDLSLRLNVNEVGVVKTGFGIHIIKRVE